MQEADDFAGDAANPPIYRIVDAGIRLPDEARIGICEAFNNFATISVVLSLDPPP